MQETKHQHIIKIVICVYPLMMVTSDTVTLAVWSLAVRKNGGQTDRMIGVEYKIETVRCIDGAINDENVAREWL